MRRLPRRYLLLGVVSDRPVSQLGLEKTIQEILKNTFGQAGIAETGTRLIQYDEKKNEAILRCNRSSVGKVRASLALITEVDRTPSTIWTIALAGSIRGLRKVRNRSLD